MIAPSDALVAFALAAAVVGGFTRLGLSLAIGVARTMIVKDRAHG